MRKLFGLSISVALGLAAFAAAPIAARDFEGDRYFTGNKTVASGDTYKDDVTVKNGTLTIYGEIEGDVKQVGFGNVVVRGGEIKGNVTEKNGGAVKVLADGEIYGHVYESGKGGVIVRGGSEVQGSVFEKWNGDVVVRGYDSEVYGSVKERHAGSVYITERGEVDGNVCELGVGTVRVNTGGYVDGSVYRGSC